MYIVTMDPTTDNASCDPITAALNNPTTIVLIDAVVTPVSAAFTKASPIVPVSSTPSIVHGPRDFSALRSDTRNPWGSLNHRRRRPYPHTRYTNSRLDSQNHSILPLPHSHRPVPSTSPLRHSFNSQSNSYSHQPPVPVNIIQTIHHPHGISPTKPKITKNIPVAPKPPPEFQERTRTARCACGNIIPAHGLDRGSRRFERRFERRFGRRSRGRFHSHRRFLDW